MTAGRHIAMLGTGLIGDFYTMTLHGGRSRDRVAVVYSRSTERGAAFQQRWDVPASTTSIDDAVDHPDVDTVVIGLPNHMHEEAVAAAVAAGKAVLCTKPLGPHRRGGAADRRSSSRTPACSAATSKTWCTRPRR